MARSTGHVAGVSHRSMEECARMVSRSQIRKGRRQISKLDEDISALDALARCDVVPSKVEKSHTPFFILSGSETG